MTLTSLRQNAVLRMVFPLNNQQRLPEPECLAPRNRFELCLTASVPQNTSLTQTCAERISFRGASSSLEPSSAECSR